MVFVDEDVIYDYVKGWRCLIQKEKRKKQIGDKLIIFQKDWGQKVKKKSFLIKSYFC